MHASFPYETNRSSRNEYGVIRRSEMLMQSHLGLDDPLPLHNALAGIVDDNQVCILLHLLTYLLTDVFFQPR